MRTPTHLLVQLLLRLMAAHYNYRPSMRRWLRGADGWIDFAVGFRTEAGTVEAAIRFRQGRASVQGRIKDPVDVTLIFKDDRVVREMLRVAPNEVLIMLMRSRMRIEGSFTVLNLFNFLLSRLLGSMQRKMERKRREAAVRHRHALAGKPKNGARAAPAARMRLAGEKSDRGVRFLEDPYLSRYRLEDFPRLARFRERAFTVKPAICAERPKLLTDWYRQNGFEVDSRGEPWVPELRQAHAYKYLMEHRRPIHREGDLLAGTTTTHEIGVVLYPDAHATTIWGELGSVAERELNPYDISEDTLRVLHHDVFPFWMKRNFREWVRARHGNPLCQVLDERFAVYFIWKTVALSHTIPDFPRLLRSGTSGLRREIEEELRLRTDGDAGKRNALAAMLLTLEGVEAWARNLSAQAAALARAATDPVRRAELSRLSEICARVPAEPARTLDEAVNAIWMGLVAVHMENGNCAISLGRLDQWLQPFLAAEMARCQSAAERQALVEHAIELVGCLFLRCADHLPLVPDIGNYLFGGSSSDQAITLGGVTPEGGDAVNDMTYIFLKVTEMLGVRDPNVNARYSPGVNSDNYLRRLCEVNLITAATPSMHNDDAVLAALAPFGYPLEDRRDWAATGCVEPTLSGRHMSNTGSVMLNLVAALEMALGDGRHPLMDWAVGPRTGVVKRGDFRTFEDFFEAFASQLRFLVDQSAQYNLWLGEAHATLRPTPLLSALLEGCITSGRDATRGGARLNSSGTTCIGLADVTDSLMAVKKLVFDDKKLSFAELQEAVDANFVGHAPVAAMARARVPLFGSGSEESVELANRIMRLVGECFGRHRNYRNGPYAVGYWTMSNHVVFGALTGALPSGRLAGKAFTPGLTPQPIASRNFLDNLRDVARLDPRAMGNNMAFNVKIAPGGDDDHAGIVERMRAYVGTYFALGGMQMQMNVVTAETLRDAMRNPEAYRHLLVRISGYNAYFVTLNTDMQVELIERAEYGI